jgi:hypothetical protein
VTVGFSFASDVLRRLLNRRSGELLLLVAKSSFFVVSPSSFALPVGGIGCSSPVSLCCVVSDFKSDLVVVDF